MYLKKLQAQGFKSFADKTTFLFEENINGIVGPNGSGKSNVVDAVRWVLGEQSVKSLRGEGSMSDVIFNGSKSRSPMSRASVALTIDNSNHYLKSEFNEIEVKHINVINMDLKGVDKLIYSNIQIKLLITEVNEKKQI